MVDKKKKVLIISYYFPPTNTIGAVRMGKFTKYLSEFGWEPMVLTVNKVKDMAETLPVELDERNIVRVAYHSHHNPFKRNIAENNSNFLNNSNMANNNKNMPLKEIALKGIRLIGPKNTIPFVYRLLFEPMGWYRYAVKAGSEILNNNHIDIIYSTYGPTVDHIIAARLHKQNGIPWIAEFRDPWSTRQPEPFYFLDKQWEKRTLRSSDLIISVTPTLVRELGSFHSKQTILITNGFDESDYTGNVIANPIFNITYTGNIYPGRRDPSPIFEALAQLRQKNFISPENVEMRFFGSNVGTYISALANKWGVGDFVKIGGSIDFKESVNKQMESTILLSLEWNNPLGSGTYTGKIFEYIGARKPILALGFKSGDIDLLLQETGCGVMSNNVIEIENILLTWLEEFKTIKKLSYYYHPNQDAIQKYTRREQTRKLAQVLDGVLSEYKLK